MELAVSIMRVAVRTLIIIIAALVASMSQYDDDIAEVGRPRWPAIGVFAAIAALTALASSFGIWWLTLIPIVLVAISAWPFKGRAATLGAIVVTGVLLQVASPVLSGQPFGWTIDDTIVVIATIVALAVLVVTHLYQDSRELLPKRPHAGEELDGNPFVGPIAITAIVTVGITIALATIG